MQLDHLLNKKVLVVGLGESGLAMARFCALVGAQVSICDTRENPPALEQLRKSHSQINFSVGLNADLLDGVECLAWSPGLSLGEPTNAAFLEAANRIGLKPTGEAQLFAEALSALQERYGYRPKVLAITGTNGKTTTTMLTAHLCKAAGLDAVAAGNVSPSMLTVLQDRLEQDHLPQVWALELSSFQLATLEKLESDASVILNVSQDHLDWHADMAEYRAAKHRIFIGANVMISNRDDPQTTPPKIEVPVVKRGFGKSKLAALEVAVLSTTVDVSLPVGVLDTVAPDINVAIEAHEPDEAAQLANAPVPAVEVAAAPTIEAVASPIIMPLQAQPKPAPSAITFGLSEPQNFGDFGVMQMTGLNWLTEAVATEDDIPGRKRQPLVKAWRANKLMPSELLPLVGGHNLSNALAALALCRAIGVSYSKLLRGLSTYKGEPHRCEPVRTLESVLYIDDSKGTNVGATIAALKGLGRKIVLIAGGDGKGQNFAALADAIQEHARAVILIGRDADRIAEQIAVSKAKSIDSIVCEKVDSLEAAVIRAQVLAQSGDAVLLSPACASFDMFKNYKHRAEVFISAVTQLESRSLNHPETSGFQFVEAEQ